MITPANGYADHFLQNSFAAGHLVNKKTAITVDQVFQLIPQFVMVNSTRGTRKVPLADWQQEVVHDLCTRELFPDLVSTFSQNTAARAVSDKMLDAGVSIDAGKPPPPEAASRPGDYPTLAGAGRSG